MWGLSDLVLFEIKVLTCNAQFNFCLLLTVLNLLFRIGGLAPAFAKSCGNFQNQTFKDHCSTELRGDKKLNLGTDYKVRALRRSFHCRDKIEFNLKSQKLEELCRFGQPACLAGRAL